ncbi:MAG: FAD:protein FMN transferase [Pseudomonadota bacterium]|nr:FAD:protein FMN transferase [Pseudomonadota bacterium]
MTQLTRRRFLTISAAMAVAPRMATASTWRGYALGGQAEITLRGPSDLTRTALKAAIDTLRRGEALYSLYDPTSTLSQLNRTGHLRPPPPEFHTLLREANTVHTATNGLFDPTVQTLWQTPNGDPSLIDWTRVQIAPDGITLGAGQTITLNGIAQGAITDMVTATLRDYGLTDCLVNMGEFAALGGPWTVGIADPLTNVVATRRLRDGAIATSSPFADTRGTAPHIQHPRGGAPLWSTVSVEAPSATRADAVSTALTLTPLTDFARVKRILDLTRITAVDFDGNIRTV